VSGAEIAKEIWKSHAQLRYDIISGLEILANKLLTFGIKEPDVVSFLSDTVELLKVDFSRYIKES
jgi:hypothetical protein